MAVNLFSTSSSSVRQMEISWLCMHTIWTMLLHPKEYVMYGMNSNGAVTYGYSNHTYIWVNAHTHTHTHTFLLYFIFIFILHECIPILGSPEFVWVKLTGLERSFYTRDIHCLPFYCPIHHWIMDHHSFLMMAYLPEIDTMTAFIDVTTLASK